MPEIGSVPIAKVIVFFFSKMSIKASILFHQLLGFTNFWQNQVIFTKSEIQKLRPRSHNHEKKNWSVVIYYILQLSVDIWYD